MTHDVSPMNRPVTLRGCGDTLEAEMIRIRLASAGIQAFVTGTDTAEALSMGGAGTDRLVRVEVADTDLKAATEVLEEDERRLYELGPWICSRCEQRNELTFDLCWNCDKSRTDDDAPAPYEEDPDPAAGEPDASLTQHVPGNSPIEDGNPYRPVLLEADDREVGTQLPTNVTDAIGKDVAHAFFAAVIGVVLIPPVILIPPLINLYSVYILLTIDRRAAALPRPMRRRKRFAWAINLGAITCWAIFCLAALIP